MKVDLIIGAGQLGSRHLQGLLKLEQKQLIYVLDPSEESLKVAEQRAKEIPNMHDLHFITDWKDLPQVLDLVIVATGSGVRAAVATKLLESHTVHYLILEKVLFQDMDSYKEVGDLIASTKTKTWVNHPRRMFEHYHEIKSVLSEAKETVVYNIVGSNWGLACNGLHYVDLFAYLSGSAVASINMDWLDKTIHESKRANYIELTGTFTGKLENNDHFVVTSFDGSVPDFTMYISTYSHRWIIREGSGEIVYINKHNITEEKETKFSPEYQSTLTTKIAQSLFDEGTCALPTYEEACASHMPFVNEALSKYIEISGQQTTFCPIT